MRNRVRALLLWPASPRTAYLDLLLVGAGAVLFYLPNVLGLTTFEAADFAPYFYVPALPFWALGALFGTQTAHVYWLQWEAIVHTALAGVGMYLLLLVLTRRRAPAATGGVVFMLSGFMTGYAPMQLAMLRAAVWLPFVLALLWQALVQPARVSHWLSAGLLAALIGLAGHGLIALFAAYVIVGWLVVGGRQAQKRWPVENRRRQWVATVAGIVIFGLCAFGLGAASWMLGNGMPDDGALAGELAMRETWQLVMPGVFTQASPLYVGTLGLILATFAACAASWGSSQIFLLPTTASPTISPNRVPQPPAAGLFGSRWMAGFFAAVALFGLLAAYGTQARLAPLLQRFVPGWALLDGQEQGAAYLVALGLSALAGLGVVWIPGAGRTLRKRVALIGGGLLTVLVYSFGLLYQLLGNTAIGNVFYLWIAFYTLAFGLAGCLLLWVDGWSKARGTLIVVMAAANLFLANMVY